MSSGLPTRPTGCWTASGPSMSNPYVSIQPDEMASAWAGCDASVLLANDQRAKAPKLKARSINHIPCLLRFTDGGQFSGQLPSDALRSDGKERLHRFTGCLEGLHIAERRRILFDPWQQHPAYPIDLVVLVGNWSDGVPLSRLRRQLPSAAGSLWETIYAFLHSCGKIVSWRCCFSSGLNNVHGQSVLL